ncbi:PREDICTED: uncharacterized protein LOC108360719 [Rhagoletis zephyria]|uniref:uncharacterized protein LOC108360719 n=1 Tax=Rhagoletis zephyria TaxID=28612 RepID=UPI000811900E|nr:PREDICTED: uncharacterized protein LOC108360719 [Rhagoletis zephyria]
MTNNCKKCNAVDDDNMVQCDTCDGWFHFTCVGVDSCIAEVSWSCDACEHSASARLTRPISSSSPTTNIGGTTVDRRVHFSVIEPTASVIATANLHGNQIFIEAHARTPGQTTQCVRRPIPVVQSTSTVSQTFPGTAAFTNPMNFVSLPISENPKTPSVINTHHNVYALGGVESMLNATGQNHSSPVSQRNLQLERLEEEFKIQQQYLENKYKILSQSSESISSNTFSLLNNGPTATQLAARQSIPKQLPMFSGDPEEWPLFISTFENSTAVAGYSDAENLIRLQACLKGKARDIVKNKLFLPSMVADIIQTLKMCFGRPEQILERAMNRARAMPPIKDKLESLIDFALCVKNICTTMEGCQMYAHLHNPLLVKELVDKLPNNQKLNWAMTPKDNAIPAVKLFSDWLYKLAEAASMVVSFTPTRGSSVMNTHTVASQDEVHQVDRTLFKNKLCCCCKGSDHNVSQCSVFKNLPLNRRWDTVKSNSLCRQCLGTHKRRCFVEKVCGIDGCTIKHHKLLHKTNVSLISNRQATKSDMLPQSDAQVNTHSHSAVGKQPYFRIVPIFIHANGKMVKVFAFLDEGSAVTLIDKNLFDELGLKGTHDPICLRWTGNTTRSENESVRATIKISNATNRRTYKLNGVHTVNALDLPEQSIDAETIAKKYPHLNGLPIESYNKVKPSLLIGADNWKLAVPLKVKEGAWMQPIASKTRLGWTVQGGQNDHIFDFRLNVHYCDCQKGYLELHERVKEFFRLESPDASNLLSAEDQTAVDLMNATCRKVDGFYEIGLPWRDPNVSLPDSYSNALNRAICLKRKCARDPNLRAEIQQQINNLVSKGYAEKLSTPELHIEREKVWYLPIFVVTNPNKPGKERLVWDAAAKAEGVSLNDFLLTGPDMLNSLFEILLAFRVGKVAICGDISEMFHRIKVRESDRHAQRFLWWDNDEESKQPNIYVMRALTFGTSCAPYIAHFVRDKNASCFEEDFPRAVEAIQKHHYVDDFIDSENNEQAALELALQVKQIHASAGFNIHSWTSNSKFVLEQLRGDAAEIQGPKEWGSAAKILGMFWDSANDSFRYICRFMRLRRDVVNNSIVPTKREILQVLMSIFDPLGLISCFTIGLKILLQDIWRSDIGWDEPLSIDLYEKWCHWKSNIEVIKTAKIPRCYSEFLQHAKEVQLHMFVDAGENAYSAVCYLRVEHTNGISVALVAAKSKVSPLKPLSIPRLELQAALVGVRLAGAVLNVQRIPITKHYFWTDSKTVLRWLRMDPKNFKPYVMHRVGEILESTNVSQWDWVPSKENPADLATKSSVQLNYKMWFSGPQFLLSQSNEWPHCEEFKGDEIDQVELKRYVLQIDRVIQKSLSLDTEYFSDWKRLYRAVATFLLVLFTCLTLRAIHMEIAHSLDTSSCVMSIRNFVARRGYPRQIFTDNGTNFKAAKKIICAEMKEVDFSLLMSTFDQISWKFIPPAAPHMGGAWERLVRSVKSVLYNIMPYANFNDESLKSSLCEVEYIINARPLTFVSLASDDDDAITPNHLLLGSPDGFKPVCTDELDLRKRWYQTQKFADIFWHRWVKEYVPIISRRSKWFNKVPPIRVGDIVVIVDENLPRNC